VGDQALAHVGLQLLCVCVWRLWVCFAAVLVTAGPSLPDGMSFESTAVRYTLVSRSSVALAMGCNQWAIVRR